MNQAVRSQEILRRLAIFDEGLVEDQAGLGLGLRLPAGVTPASSEAVRVPSQLGVWAADVPF